MACPLCRKRPTKRACPALRQEICTVCCATKRLVEIDAPRIAATWRRPTGTLPPWSKADSLRCHPTNGNVGRLTEQQLQLFFLLQSMVLSYKPEGLARLVDTDIALASRGAGRIARDREQGVISRRPLPPSWRRDYGARSSR